MGKIVILSVSPLMDAYDELRRRPELAEGMTAMEFSTEQKEIRDV